jgi:4-carboxymuconolactone decarboxylase
MMGRTAMAPNEQARKNHDELFPGHIAADLNVSNDHARLIDVLTQLLPFIGYPRTLNALRVIDEVIAS